MQTSSTIGAIATALAEAQKNFAPIPKDREVTVRMKSGGTYKFKYATLDAIRSATMPALAAQGLALVQGLSEDNRALETSLIHGSGEWLKNATPMTIDGERSNQAMGSAQSYARRYGLSAMLCVTADEDDDGNAADGNDATHAGSGGHFRPERRGGSMTDEAARDGTLDTTRAKGTLPAKPAPATNGSAVKRLEWCAASIKTIRELDKEGRADWWKENAERLGVIEGALPNEYEKLTQAMEA